MDGFMVIPSCEFRTWWSDLTTGSPRGAIRLGPDGEGAPELRPGGRSEAVAPGGERHVPGDGAAEGRAGLLDEAGAREPEPVRGRAVGDGDGERAGGEPGARSQ